MQPAQIPVGLSTRVGLIVSAVLAVIAGATAVLEGDHTAETLTSLVLAVVTLVTVLQGRYGQAKAAAAGSGSLQPGSNESVTISRYTASESDDDEHLDADDLAPGLANEPVGPIPVRDEGDGDVAVSS